MISARGAAHQDLRMDEVLCTSKHVGCNLIKSHDEGLDKKMAADVVMDDVDVTLLIGLSGRLRFFYLEVTYSA